MAGWADVKSAIWESQAVKYDRGGEINVRCPYCGDSRNDPTSAHLYINSHPPHAFNCFRCADGRGGALTAELLEKLGAATREAAVYARQIGKEFRRAGNRTSKQAAGRRSDPMKIPPPDRADPFDAACIGYLEGRLERQFENWEIERYKIVVGLERFLRANAIEHHTLDKNQEKFDRLNSQAVGFLSSDESQIIFRHTDPEWGKNVWEKRYTNYQVYDRWEGSKLYTTRQKIDLEAESYEVVIGEGIIDTIQAEAAFHAERRGKPDFLGVACCGTSFSDALRRIVSMGMFPLHVHAYMDDEAGMAEKLRRLPRASPMFRTENFRLSVYRNEGTDDKGRKHKDFGVPFRQMKRTKIHI